MKTFGNMRYTEKSVGSSQGNCITDVMNRMSKTFIHRNRMKDMISHVNEVKYLAFIRMTIKYFAKVSKNEKFSYKMPICVRASRQRVFLITV